MHGTTHFEATEDGYIRVDRVEASGIVGGFIIDPRRLKFSTGSRMGIESWIVEAAEFLRQFLK
jgi:hypothetical protein